MLAPRFKGSFGGFLATVLLTLGAIPTAAAAAPLNDDFAGRLPIQFSFTDTRSNIGAGIEADEPFTANDPAGLMCHVDEPSTTAGIQMDATLWWDFTGNGGTITVSTQLSSFDTVLAVYEADSRELIGCDDDVQPYDPTRRELGGRVESELVVQTVAGRHYAVQVGSCSPIPACARTTVGDIKLRVSPTPPNDDRAHATPVSAGPPVAASSTGATLEPGETTTCASSLFAKTVWYRWTAPAIGTAVFTTSGFDTVLTVYRADTGTPVGCNDDAIRKESGASSLPMTQPPGPPVVVTPGDYLIQVGGYYDVGFSTVAARNGAFELQVSFAEDLDVDDDGVDRGADCDDHNPAIHPGAAEVPNNDVDENCDGVKAFDRDGDGALAPPAGSDCRDDRADIRPGAHEVPSNGVDEDCDGADASLPSLPTEIAVDYAGRRGIVDVFGVRLKRVPPGGRVELRCRGRGCPFGHKALHTRRGGRLELLRRFGLRDDPPMRLRVGAVLEIRVTHQGSLGRAKRYVFRRGQPATTAERCFAPIGTVPC